jgi:membrane protease YdiL (CAAX protease family)
MSMDEPIFSERDVRAVPWHRADLAAFAGFFIATVLLLPVVVFFVFRLFSGSSPTAPSGLEIILAQALIDIAVVGFICFVIRLHGLPILRTLHWLRPPNSHFGKLILTGAFLAITVLLASSLFPSPPESALDKLLTTPASVAAFVILGIVVAPVMEEIMFRGFLYTVLADLYGPGLAVPVTSVAFAGLHFLQLWGNWPAMLLILVVGYILTNVRKRSDSLIPSVVMHTAYNSTIFFGISALSLLVERAS